MTKADIRANAAYAGTGAPLQPIFMVAPSSSVVTTIARQLTTNYWTANHDTPPKFNVKPGGTLNADLSGLTDEGKALAIMALDAWTQVTGILFNTAPSVGATIHLQFDDSQSGAYTSFDKAGTVINRAYVNVSTAWIAAYGTGVAGYSLQTYIHEIGHALGLGHAGNYNGSASFGSQALFAQDSWQMSIMSYFSQDQNPNTGSSFAWTLGPMMADMKAVETIYGVNAKAGYGATTYGVGANGSQVQQAIGAMMATGSLAQSVSFTVMDRNGTDLFDFSTDTLAQVVNLLPGSISSVYGLVGNVLIEGATLIENLRLGHGNDAARGNASGNSITGGEGNDTIEGGDGWDSLDGGLGNDALLGGTANDTLTGAEGTDWLSGDDGDDKAYGGDAADTLLGGAGKDLLDGGADADRIEGGDGNDSMLGGDAADTLLGGTGNDTIYGGEAVDQLEGGDGDDAIYGDAGAETLYGGLGNDKLYGGGDDDSLSGDLGNDAMYGGDGVDSFDAGEGNDSVYGDAGAETVQGGNGNDKLYGGADSDQLATGAGNDLGDGGLGDDTVLGEAGNDSLLGVDGADSLVGDIGNDSLFGGTGDDTLLGGDGNDSLRGDEGNDSLDGGAGNDGLDGSAGDDRVIGGVGDDKLSGSAGADSIQGGEGNDQLFGGTENDGLFGDAGNDILSGDAGDDVLAGESGVDQLTGGAGADVFIMMPGDGSSATAYDTIKDFVTGTDHISFGDTHASAVIGTAAFSGAAGQVRYTSSSAGAMVQLDSNGDMTADVTFLLVKYMAPVLGDFL